LAWLGEVYEAAAAAYLMGDTPFLLMQWTHAAQRTVVAERLAQLIAGNIDHPHRELMWGAPGTLLATLFLHQSSGEPRWMDLFVQTAAKLWSQLVWSDEFQCYYWTQDMYGKQSTYLDGVHGFVATAFVLIKGRHLLDQQDWQQREQRIVQTMERTASQDGDFANWRAHLITPQGEMPRMLMQFCHGAPGFVICLAELPDGALDSVLLRAFSGRQAPRPLFKYG
jgi:lantibiotic modifying enzyme